MSKSAIDLSKFNTIKENGWPKIKGAVDAVIPRLGYRGATTGTITYDPKYNDYIAACEKYGIPKMFYFFPCSITEKEAEAEANFIISAAKKIDLCGPIWLDSEIVFRNKSGRSDRLSKTDRTKFLNVILRKLHAAGYECGVYASKSWFANNLNDDDLESFCLRWVAQWASECTYTKHNIDMWQYTSDGSVSGVAGRVDISEVYINLDGAAATQAVKSSVTRQDIVDQICSWEGWDEVNGKYKIIINIYNYYLPTAVKRGCVNYKVRLSDEWCATAASAAYIQAGAPELFPVECGCPRMITLAKEMGIWKEADDYVPDPADAVLYDWQDSGSGDNKGTPDHIGIVISVDKKAGTFVVMEGNKNETVGRRTMKINGKYIRGFITPKFNTTASTTTAAASTTTAAASTTDSKASTQKKISSSSYTISKTGVPSKEVILTGLLKYDMKVTARRQPRVTGEPCSFSPIKGLTRISVCDYIADSTGRAWAYCKVGEKYGYILDTSIKDYVRIGGQTIEKAAKWAMEGDFGTGQTMINALQSLRYNPAAVQSKIKEMS